MTRKARRYCHNRFNLRCSQIVHTVIALSFLSSKANRPWHIFSMSCRVNGPGLILGSSSSERARPIYLRGRRVNGRGPSTRWALLANCSGYTRVARKYWSELRRKLLSRRCWSASGVVQCQHRLRSWQITAIGRLIYSAAYAKPFCIFFAEDGFSKQIDPDPDDLIQL